MGVGLWLLSGSMVEPARTKALNSLLMVVKLSEEEVPPSVLATERELERWV